MNPNTLVTKIFQKSNIQLESISYERFVESCVSRLRHRYKYQLLYYCMNCRVSTIKICMAIILYSIYILYVQMYNYR